jgi:hypothetical protein
MPHLDFIDVTVKLHGTASPFVLGLVNMAAMFIVVAKELSFKKFVEKQDLNLVNLLEGEFTNDTLVFSLRCLH